MQNVTTSSVRLTQCLFIPKKASSKAFACSPSKEPNKNQSPLTFSAVFYLTL